MHPRTVVALGVAGLAAVVAIGFGFLRQVGVKSYGMPAGRVVRAGPQLAVLMQTKDPFLPSLKGRSESDMSYSYELWFIPEAGDGAVRKVGLDRGVASGSRMHTPGVHHFENGVVWLHTSTLQGVEVDSGKKVGTPPPAVIANAPVSRLLGDDGENPLEEYRAKALKLPSGEWLFLANEDEVAKDLKPGKRLYDNPTAERGLKVRRLYVGTEAPGVIPTLGSVKPLGTQEFKSGALMRATKGGEAIRFANPDGFLVVHHAGDPVHPTLHFSRVNVDGSVAWTADTKIGRLTQVLAHGALPAFVGELVPSPGHLVEPVVAVLRVGDGTVKTVSLKGPVN